LRSRLFPEEAFNIAGAVEHSNDFDPVFKCAVKDQVIGKRFDWKHSHASQEGASIFGDSAHIGLACKEPEGFFGGAIETHGRFHVAMGGKVFGLLIKITAAGRSNQDSALHPAALTGLCLCRSSLRLCAQ